MIRRLFKNNTLFAVLYILSLTMTFIVLYYGMSYIRQEKNINETYRNMDSETNIFFISDWTKGLHEELYNIDIDSSSTLLSVLFTTVVNERNNIWVEIVAGDGKVREELQREFDSDNNGIRCYVGQYWGDRLEYKNGDPFINICDREVKVSGVLKNLGLDGKDERIIIYGAEKEADYYLWSLATQDAVVRYRSDKSKEMAEDEAEKLYYVLEKFSVKGEEIKISEDFYKKALLLDYNLDVLKGYKTIINMLFLFCMINIAFLSFVWSLKHKYEFVLKRTVGFNDLRIWIDSVYEILVFIIASLMLTIFATLLYELINGRKRIWIQNIEKGSMYALICLVVVIFIATVFSLINAKRIDLAECLKNNE